MVKTLLSKTRTVVTPSALVVVGWLAAFAGWLLPAKFIAVKAVCLAVARALP